MEIGPGSVSRYHFRLVGNIVGLYSYLVGNCPQWGVVLELFYLIAQLGFRGQGLRLGSRLGLKSRTRSGLWIRKWDYIV